MKKFLLSILIISFCMVFIPSFADDNINTDLWSDYSAEQIINNGKEAEYITDEDFEKAFDEIDAKVNKWKRWAEKRKMPKGENFSKSNESEVLNEEHGEDASLPVMSLPVELKIGEGIVPIGHYQVKGEMIDGQPVLSLYQAHYLMAKVPAIETKDDFDKEEILFADWENVNDNQIKIIYGSLDFNAYAIVDMTK